jgi:hypothetical protein
LALDSRPVLAYEAAHSRAGRFGPGRGKNKKTALPLPTKTGRRGRKARQESLL